MTSLLDPPCLIEHEPYVENAVWILHTLSTWECSSNERLRPWGRGRYSDIFIHTYAWGHFFGLKILNFNILGFFSENEYFGGGMKNIFWVLVILDIFFRVNSRCGARAYVWKTNQSSPPWKSGHITSVKCIPFTIEWDSLCQTSQDARKLGHYRSVSETPSEWRFAGGPIVARDWVLAGFTLGSYIK